MTAPSVETKIFALDYKFWTLRVSYLPDFYEMYCRIHGQNHLGSEDSNLQGAPIRLCRSAIVAAAGNSIDESALIFVTW